MFGEPIEKLGEAYEIEADVFAGLSRALFIMWNFKWSIGEAPHDLGIEFHSSEKRGLKSNVLLTSRSWSNCIEMQYDESSGVRSGNTRKEVYNYGRKLAEVRH